MTYSPVAGIKTNKEPAMIPGILNGNVILKNVFIGPEPKSAAASFRPPSSFSIFAYRGNIIKGRYV